MIKDYEIERKFLVEYPDVSELNLRKTAEILQTYLKNNENETQRRVRKIKIDGKTVYTYTEKLFLTAVTRKEMEYEIDEAEYKRLVVQAREDCVPIEKVRYCFEYDSQLFELDVYPFSDDMAILEIELDNPEQQIRFPDNVKVLKEVTDDSSYANAALALAASFPESAHIIN
jgi:CYTH domain-containing protein